MSKTPSVLSPILCDPTERPQSIIQMVGGIRDSMANEYGCDYLWSTPYGWAGIQRKVFPSDFLKSLNDGLLAKEILKMGELKWGFLLLEGKPNWGTNGELQGQYKGGISIKHLDSVLNSIDMFRGIRVRWTESIGETTGMIRRLYDWTSKEDHTGFCAQIETNRGELDPSSGKRIKVDWREWILMHLPDIGQKTARAILKHEPEPLEWWNRGRDLEKVPGIGKITAEQMRKALKPPAP
jgi:ERCC4-type nuclease